MQLHDCLKHDKTLQILLHPEDGTVEIHANKVIKAHKLPGKRKALGIDKGYTDLVACSSGNLYGSSIGALMEKETEAQNIKLQARNKVWAQIQKCTEEGDFEKAERIKENNFGRKKWNSQRRKAKAHIESETNHAIRRMIREENPSKIVLEKLNFSSWAKKLPPKVKRKLSRWQKGLLDERIVYIASLYKVKTEYINPAYTSQVCSVCGCLGNRNGKSFHCPHCGHREDADTNAAKNILQRSKEKEITLYTPHKQVKKIYEERTKAYDEKHGVKPKSMKQEETSVPFLPQ